MMCTIARNKELMDILNDSVDAYVVSHKPDEFRFLFDKIGSIFDNSVSIIEKQKEKEIRDRVNNESHQSELWRQAVISATNSKHPDPITFADKVLSSYNEKFTIFA